jgi:hypothetical protein
MSRILWRSAAMACERGIVVTADNPSEARVQLDR